MRAVRALRHLPGLTAARIGAALFAGMVVGACNPAPSEPAEPAHEKHLTPRLIAQRIMYCDDGSRADVDFIDEHDRNTTGPAGPAETGTAGR